MAIFPVLKANSLVQIRTALGTAEIELFDQDKPVTVANFKRYVEAGLYQNTFFHRAVENFVLQGGALTVTNRGLTNVQFAAIPTFPTITNEIFVGPFLSNVAGTIAMAKTSDPNSATSQFFLNLVDNSVSLDNTNNSGGFTVFGRVRGDTNILAKLNSFSRRNVSLGTNAIAAYGRGEFAGILRELPTVVVIIKNGALDLESLVYADITLLSVQVAANAQGEHEISWNAAPGGTNQVEFTTVFPPEWQSLTNVVHPLAGRVTVTDSVPSTNRFYRVRIAY